MHRSAYLDYIGVKVFDDAGDVVGERRFLGLFSSAAYRTSVRELPVVRRKVAEVLDRSGLSPRSHSGKDLLQILETYPRDELFQIKTDDLYQAVDRRAAHGRAPPAAAVPAPRRVRPVHLLPDLPAPGPVHHRATGCACRRSCCAS